jgi:hypothetical protein
MKRAVATLWSKKEKGTQGAQSAPDVITSLFNLVAMGFIMLELYSERRHGFTSHDE